MVLCTWYTGVIAAPFAIPTPRICIYYSIAQVPNAPQ